MSDPYPASSAERRRIRDRKASEGAKQGRIKALGLVTSLKCSGFDGAWPTHHASESDGCRNDGSTCLCECHDEEPA